MTSLKERKKKKKKKKEEEKRNQAERNDRSSTQRWTASIIDNDFHGPCPLVTLAIRSPTDPSSCSQFSSVRCSPLPPDPTS
jgi:hypothetical protein